MIKSVNKSHPTLEGAGVHLKRAVGNYRNNDFDPFLLLDDFRSNNPKDYLAGFPWHPHRGIETITYVLKGDVEHGDSLGHNGVISEGDIQWMTAGSGIIHQEMPKGDLSGKMQGFQLWANLPASHKMMDPRYRGITKEMIPIVETNNGIQIRVICGDINGTVGPVTDIITDPEYLDIIIPPNHEFNHKIEKGKTVFAYVIDGAGYFDKQRDPYCYEFNNFNSYDLNRDCLMHNETIILYGDGDQIQVSTEKESVRFLLISGRPLNEPVAWYGPIVMNTQEELRIAFEEYRNGSFIKVGRDKDIGQ